MNMTDKTSKLFLIAALLAATSGAMLVGTHPALADSQRRYAGFPSVQYYDVDAELRKRNIDPDDAIEPTADGGKRTPDANGAAATVFVVEQKVADFLKIAAKRNDLRVNISGSVRGVIRNMDLPSSLDQMLALLSDTFQFGWYQDGDTLFVSDRSENASRVIALGRSSFSELKHTLSEAGFKGAGYTMKYVSDSNSVMVNGPASLIAKIEVLAAGKAENKSGPKLIKFGVEH